MKKKQIAVKQSEIIYGAHSVTELLKQKQRKVYELFVLKPEPKLFKNIEQLLPNYKIPVNFLPKEQLNRKLGTTDHQGIGALVQPFAYRKKFFTPEKEPFLLLLDGVQDVRNCGAIIRSAYCTGVNGIIVISNHAAPITAAAHKASAGLAERMPIYQAPSIVSAIQELKKAGYTIYVTALGAKQDATQITYKKPLCVIVGNEGKGVSPESKQAGTIVTLPQQSSDVSYNASVAAALVLFMIAYQQ